VVTSRSLVVPQPVGQFGSGHLGWMWRERPGLKLSSQSLPLGLGCCHPEGVGERSEGLSAGLRKPALPVQLRWSRQEVLPKGCHCWERLFG
jgi:hypothetical protein